MFLWRYPRVVPFTQVNAAIGAWFFDASFRLGFPGVAKSVVDQIRANNPDLESVCLVGNSLGAGIALQGYSELVADNSVRFVLVAPTEVFLPPVPGEPLSTLPPLLQRTVIASDASKDAYFSGPPESSGLAQSYITLNGKNAPWPEGYWPRGYVPPASRSFAPHWIIPSGAPMGYVFDLIGAAYSLPP
jgi:hypothetical protein